MARTKFQKTIDFFTFPIRALALFFKDRFGLSSLRTERFDYVAKEVQGFCLDVGCGEHNLFIANFLNGNGKGIDVFPYDGLCDENVFEDLVKFPFKDKMFDTVTFIACLNHIPKSERDLELKEAFRCLKPGGNIVVTMGNPIAEIFNHKLVWLYDKLLGTKYDVDSERGMSAEEDYYLTDNEIVNRLNTAGFKNIKKKSFLTQWGLNHLFVAWKP